MLKFRDYQLIQGQLEVATSRVKGWLSQARALIQKNEMDKGDTLTWSAHQLASAEGQVDEQDVVVTQLLPLFYGNCSHDETCNGCYYANYTFPKC